MCCCLHETIKLYVKFVNFENSAKTAEDVNDFVENKTMGRITDFAREDTFNAKDRVFFVNAIWLKSKWKRAFEKNRGLKGPFYFDNDKTNYATVDYMEVTSEFNHADLDDLEASAIEMDYAHSNFSFVAILPTHLDGLPKLEARLKGYELKSILQRMTMWKSTILMPEFKVTYEIKLNAILAKVSENKIKKSKK